MRLHRFYIEGQLPTSGTYTVLDERMIHQWKHVFRYGEGDAVILFTGTGVEVRGVLEIVSKDKAVVRIEEQLTGGWLPKREVYLYAALIKKDKFEWLAEKCTELGVSKIVPVIAERTIKKDINLERLHAIVIEASEQSERGSVPTVAEPISLADALLETEKMERFVCIKGGSDLVRDAESTTPIVLFIGPEGGWSDDERALFKDEKIKTLSLGVQNLKAETAAIVAVSRFL